MNNMLLVTSAWKDKPTFKLIPVSLDCPYNEIIFDPEVNVLAIVSKQKKDSFHMMPRLTEHGDIMKANSNKRDHGKNYSEQRVALETYYEYFISEPTEMTSIINTFAINADIFDFQSTIDAAFAKVPAAEPEPSLN